MKKLTNSNLRASPLKILGFQLVRLDCIFLRIIGKHTCFLPIFLIKRVKKMISSMNEAYLFNSLKRMNEIRHYFAEYL